MPTFSYHCQLWFREITRRYLIYFNVFAASFLVVCVISSCCVGSKMFLCHFCIHAIFFQFLFEYLCENFWNEISFLSILRIEKIIMSNNGYELKVLKT